MARRSLSVLTVALTAALLPAGGAAAIGRTWDGGGDGIDWYDPANWAPDGGPDVWDALTVIGASAATGEDVTADQGGRIELIDHGASASFRRLFVGEVGGAGLYVADGAGLYTSSAYLADGAGSEATAAVVGEDTVWDYDGGGLYVGERGRGVLEILDGATVRGSVGAIAGKPGSSGTVTVAGTNTKWAMKDNLFVGHRDEGLLRIWDGASVDVTDYGSIGHVHDGVGYVTVEGPGSSFDIGRNLRVGFDGEGWLTIADGAAGSSPDLYVGAFEGSKGTVSVMMPGSRWTSTGEVTVGGEGTGLLDLFHGGTVRSARGYVGRERGSVGEVHIFESGSQWSTDILTVGSSGAGLVSVAMGGRVVTTSTSTVYVGKSAGSNGAMDIHGPGATCAFGGDLSVGNLGTGEITTAIGGRLETARATLGVAPGSVGRAAVVGADSSWQLGGRMIVGDRGEGALDIVDGATVVARDCLVGFDDGGVGRATLDGAGSSWSTWALYVGGGQYNEGTWISTEGGAGTGELTVSNGAELRPLWTYVGASPGAVGHVTVSNATWDSQEGIYAGAGGIGTVEIVDGSTVTSKGGYVGWYEGGEGMVTVAGAGSSWTHKGLDIGLEGGSGTVEILDGGRIDSTNSIHVGGHHGSTGRLVVGGGTIALGQDVSVGRNGVGEMDIVGAGVVDSRKGFIGYERRASGVATVRGAGSRWAMTQELNVGEFCWDDEADYPDNTPGSGTLIIADGGEVSSQSAYVAPRATGTGSVTVDGAGSTWRPGHCVIGDRGEGALEILHGATVIGQDCSVGFEDGAVGRATLDGAGSSWTTWKLNVGGGRYHDGGWIEGGAGDGELTVSHGAELRPLWTYVGGSAGAVGHVTVRDATWDNQEGIYVGVSGTGTVDISHGSTVLSRGGYIGWHEGGDGTVAVAGAGTTWTHGGLYLGLWGGDGTMAVLDGGLSYGTASAYVGDYHGSTGRLTVDGATFVQEQEVRVGYRGFGEMLVTGGGVVDSRGGDIGYERRATGVATVCGDGSRWTMAADLRVGESYWDDEEDYPDNTPGSGTLIVCDGGEVSNQSAYVAPKATGTGSVRVCGAGSEWNTRQDAFIGKAGDGALEIRCGGDASTRRGYVGYDQGSAGRVLVDGHGSTWAVSSELTLGHGGDATVEVTRGGRIEAGDTTTFIGAAGDSDSIVTVRGPGSQLVTRTLWVGGAYDENGGRGVLEVRRGADAVTNVFATIGFCPESDGRVTVAGPGSTWTIGRDIQVGGDGVGLLEILHGGRVICGQDGYSKVGWGTYNAGTGEVLVAGCGSTWDSGDRLVIGKQGAGTVTVRDGGQVLTGQCSLADQLPTDTAAVRIEGAGSLWTTTGHLHVGLAGTGSLHVTGGGRLVSGNSYLGSFRDARGEVSVAGGGSRWDVDGKLYLAAGLGRASMEITDGATVRNGTAYMAFEYGGSDAQVTVAGGGALWEIGGNLFLAGYDYENGGSGRLEILPGGTVAVGGKLYLWTDGVVDLDGGTIRFDAGEPWPIEWHGGEFNFGSGMVAFDGNMTVVGGGTFVNELFGSPVTLPAGKGLGITGTATLDAPVTLNGGTFAAGQLAGIDRLEFNTGTLSLTDTALTIGPGGLFGKTLSLAEGQHVSVTRPTTITHQGRLELAGGSFSSGHLTNRGRIDIVEKPGDLHGRLLNDAGGKVIVSDGAGAFFHDDVHHHGSLFKVSRGCSATFYGQYWGKGIRGKGDVFFAGRTEPGLSPGIVIFETSVAFAPGSELSIELGDNDNSDPLAAHYDSVAVDGNVALDGALLLEWLPALGEGGSKFGGDYDILTYAGELTGEFDEIAGGIGPAYLAGIDYAAEIGEGTRGVRVTLHDLIDGDVDLDGEVGYADYAAARDGFAAAAEATWAGGDLDLDGDVDVHDYLALKLNFGRSVGGGAAAPAVPEPMSLALLAALALPLLRRRRRT